MWVEPKPIGIYNHSRRSNIFSSDEKNYLRGPKMSLMHTICVVCCWRSNLRLVIVAPLAVKINAPGTPSSFKRGRYPACYNQPLLQPAPVSPKCFEKWSKFQHGIGHWLGAVQATSHCLNQCWHSSSMHIYVSRCELNEYYATLWSWWS